jgi:hypothetical protein
MVRIMDEGGKLEAKIEKITGGTRGSKVTNGEELTN